MRSRDATARDIDLGPHEVRLRLAYLMAGDGATFDPEAARWVVLERLQSSELDDDEAMLLLALSTAERTEWMDEALIRTSCLRDVRAASAKLDQLATRGWFRRSVGAAGATRYQWRREGPGSCAWVQSRVS